MFGRLECVGDHLVGVHILAGLVYPPQRFDVAALFQLFLGPQPVQLILNSGADCKRGVVPRINDMNARHILCKVSSPEKGNRKQQ